MPANPQHVPETLVTLFNATFGASHNTRLICCEAEPIYRPADAQYPFHRIIFAHGFFASALHEVAHWCVAGPQRRLVEDYGYWYEPDGRSNERQNEFEKVEVKPQALELLFSLASQHVFHFSADNLEGNVGVSASFKAHVYEQAKKFLDEGMPSDAQIFFNALLNEYRNGKKISELEIPVNL